MIEFLIFFETVNFTLAISPLKECFSGDFRIKLGPQVSGLLGWHF